MRFGCPACGRRYQVGRALDAYGALVDCPGCDHQFLLFPTADQRSGPEPQIDERFLTRLGEAASGAMSSPADTPLDDEPSDIEVTAHTAIARGARPSAAPTLPSGPPRRVRPGGWDDGREHPSIEPDVDLVRFRHPQHGADPSELARQLIDEERLVSEDRYLRDGTRRTQRIVAWAAFSVSIVLCAGFGALAGAWSSLVGGAPVPRPDPPLGAVLAGPAPVAPSAAVVASDGGGVDRGAPPPPPPGPAPSAPAPGSGGGVPEP